MALISIQNFIEPFKRPVHLIAICLLAGIIGVWRASGGKIEIEHRGGVAPASRTQHAPARAQQPTRQAPASAHSATQRNNSNLDSLMKRGDMPTKNARPTTPAGSKSNSALDDIEKSLGLRR